MTNHRQPATLAVLRRHPERSEGPPYLARAGKHLGLAIAALSLLAPNLHAQTGVQTTPDGGRAVQDYAAAITLADPRAPIASKPGALTLQQVLDAARLHNPNLIAAERNLSAVRAQEIQAAVRQNPYLQINGAEITYPAAAQNPYTYTAQFSRLFERGSKREWRIDNAKATTAQTAAQLEDTIRQLNLTIKTAFVQMLEAKASLQVTSAQLKEFQHEVDIAEDRYKAGDLAKIDFERLDLQLSSFESAEATDMVNLRQSSTQLQTLIGAATINTDFDIAGSIVPPAVPQTLAALTQTALDKRPDLSAAKFAIEAAVANRKLTFANGTTDPTLEVEYDRAGHENSVGFYVNIPLRLFDRNQGNKKTSLFQEEASRFTATAVNNQVVSDVDQAFSGYLQSKRLSDRYTNHFLDETKDVLSIAQFAFEHGGIALIDYLDAVRDSRTVDAAALAAYQQTWLAIHQLSAATATELVP